MYIMNMRKMSKQIFVNLPIKDMGKTKEFFNILGFSFNPRFSDENALCMVVGENIYAMLLAEKFFGGFIPGKEICDTGKNIEVLVAIDAESREAVDEMIKKAENSGGKEYREAQDNGWMYSRAFEDLDSHVWEVMYMDESKMLKEMKNKENDVNE
jgi:uncharacterized protein